jgi:hypothetical protein
LLCFCYKINDEDFIIARAVFVVNDEKDKKKQSLVDDTPLQKYYGNQCNETDILSD